MTMPGLRPNCLCLGGRGPQLRASERRAGLRLRVQHIRRSRSRGLGGPFQPHPGSLALRETLRDLFSGANAAITSAGLAPSGHVLIWGSGYHGQLGNGVTETASLVPLVVPDSVTSVTLLVSDVDGDGLSNEEEAALGTDSGNRDTNGDGVLDGAAQQAGLSLTNTDMDADGLSNADEAARGTDPFMVDTDGDGVSDGQDCFPLDATRWQCPAPNPNDHTPPTITLEEPANATLISSEPQ